MPYIAFERIPDADDYEFDDWSMGSGCCQDHCVKELGWASDELWNYIKKVANDLENESIVGDKSENVNSTNTYDQIRQKDSELYYRESIRIYLNIRLKSCKIVNIQDETVKQYLDNHTIKFITGLIQGLAGEQAPFEIEEERESVREMVSFVSTVMANERARGLIMKLGYIGDRLEEYYHEMIEKIPGVGVEGRLGLMSNTISLSFNIASFLDMYESLKFIESKAQKYDIPLAFPLTPTSSQIIEFDNELALMRDYLNNIALSMKDDVDKKRTELNTQLQQLRNELAQAKAVQEDEENLAKQKTASLKDEINKRREEKLKILDEIENIEDPEEKKRRKISLMDEIKSDTLKIVSAKFDCIRSTQSRAAIFSLKSHIRGVKSEIKALESPYSDYHVSVQEKLKNALEGFLEAFGLKGIEKLIPYDKEPDDEKDEDDNGTAEVSETDKMKKRLKDLKKNSWNFGSRSKTKSTVRDSSDDSSDDDSSDSD